MALEKRLVGVVSFAGDDRDFGFGISESCLHSLAGAAAPEHEHRLAKERILGRCCPQLLSREALEEIRKAQDIRVLCEDRAIGALHERVRDAEALYAL